MRPGLRRFFPAIMPVSSKFFPVLRRKSAKPAELRHKLSIGHQPSVLLGIFNCVRRSLRHYFLDDILLRCNAQMFSKTFDKVLENTVAIKCPDKVELLRVRTMMELPEFLADLAILLVLNRYSAALP